MGLGVRGWRLIGLVMEMGGFSDQGVEIGGLGVEMGGFSGQGVEIDRFSDGDGWV